MMATRSGAAPGPNKPVAPPDKARVLAELPAAMDQFCELVLTVDDLDVGSLGRWSASDIAAHVASMLELYVGLAGDGGSPVATIEALGDVSQSLLERVQDRRPPALVERIRGGVRALTDVARSRDGDPSGHWHTGLLVPTSVLLGLMIGEATVHGYDIARATGRRWRVPSAWAETTARAVGPILPLYVEPAKSADLDARIDLRLRGTDFRAMLTFANGGLQICEPQGDRVDCHVSGAPAALLVVLYQRINPVLPALAGHVVAWGRKPWLAFRLPSLFYQP